MIKKTLFTIDYYLKENFINQSEIDKICDSIDRKSLTDYDYIKGNAKTSIGVSQNQFLDFHKDLEEKIVKEIPIKNQRMAESWVTIQKEDFINQSEIDKICDSIDKNSLIDYDYIQGNAKTSMGVNQNQFLDFHKDLEDKIVKKYL